MQFDLKQFLHNGREPWRQSFTVDLRHADFPGYTVDAPASAQFAAYPGQADVELVLRVESQVCASCARCLAPVRQPVCFERRWLVRPSDPDSEEFELPLAENGVLDLAELVYQELVLEVEPVLLCSPDCQGLCPVCGQPKAAGCACQRQAGDDAPADARLSILKQLLQ